jgi:hypothetical protein
MVRLMTQDMSTEEMISNLKMRAHWLHVNDKENSFEWKVAEVLEKLHTSTSNCTCDTV